MNKKVLFIIIFVVVAVSLFLGGFSLGLHNSKYSNKCKDTPIEEEKIDTNDTGGTTIYSGSNDMEIDVDKIVLEKNSSYDSTLTNNIEIVKRLKGVEVSSYRDFKDKNSAFKLFSGITLVAKNNNSEPVDLDFKVEYYDDKGEVVYTDYDSEMLYSVLPGKLFSVKIKMSPKVEYKSYKLIYGAQHKRTYHINIDVSKDDFKVIEETSFSTKNIKVYYENKTDKKLNVSGTVVYYKNNEIVFINTIDLIDISPGDTKEGVAYGHQIGNREYDRFDFIPVSAYYTESEWK